MINFFMLLTGFGYIIHEIIGFREFERVFFVCLKSATDIIH